MPTTSLLVRVMLAQGSFLYRSNLNGWSPQAIQKFGERVVLSINDFWGIGCGYGLHVLQTGLDMCCLHRKTVLLPQLSLTRTPPQRPAACMPQGLGLLVLCEQHICWFVWAQGLGLLVLCEQHICLPYPCFLLGQAQS